MQLSLFVACNFHYLWRADPCYLPGGESPCQNNGTCIVDGDTYCCRCPPEYTGRDCTLKFNIHACKKGHFTSPNYPGPYPPNKWYFYILKVDEGSKVRLTFDDFDVEKTAHCSSDVVSVIDGFFDPYDSSNVLAKLCGTKKDIGNATFKSSGNILTLKFKTDWTVQNKGFKVSYQQEFPEPPTISADKTNLIDGETAKLTCQSTLVGNNYLWFKNGNLVAQTSSIIQTKADP
ncbi:hypothetical protein ACOMHN_004163 [Nucella lapillus]